jgi:hypothetical protein
MSTNEREILLQAESLQDLKSWVDSLGKVCRQPEPGIGNVSLQSINSWLEITNTFFFPGLFQQQQQLWLTNGGTTTRGRHHNPIDQRRILADLVEQGATQVWPRFALTLRPIARHQIPKDPAECVLGPPPKGRLRQRHCRFAKIENVEGHHGATVPQDPGPERLGQQQQRSLPSGGRLNRRAADPLSAVRGE